MSTTLLFLIPIGLLAVVWSVCFVGCTLQTSGIPEPYSNVILGETGLLAYWPLNDATGTPSTPPPQGSAGIGTAADLSGNSHAGSYLLPPIYPTNPPQGSVPIPGVPIINMQQGSIVPGDVGNSTFTDKNTNPACADFEGGYVSIPWNTPKPLPLDQFTLEAWIAPHFTGANFSWVVFSAFLNNAGFRVLIDGTQNNGPQLAVVIGNGTAGVEFTLTSPINPGDTTYIAATCDMSGNVTLFAEGLQQDTPATPQMFPGTGYVPVDATQQVNYFIGAGQNAVPPRTQNGAMGAPEFPFQGAIQSVALYGTALDPTDLQSHFQAGTPEGG
jgi:hypothetical protein